MIFRFYSVGLFSGGFKNGKIAQSEYRYRLDFRRSLVSGLPSPRRVRGRSAGSFPEQRLVIEPSTVIGSTKVVNVKENHRLSMLVRLSTKILEKGRNSEINHTIINTA